MADMHGTGEEPKGLTWLVWCKPPESYKKKNSQVTYKNYLGIHLVPRTRLELARHC